MNKNLMKYALAIGVSTIAFHANAADYMPVFDLTPDTTRIISDPSYLPTQGQIYGSTSYSYGASTFHETYANGFSWHQSGGNNTTTQVINYGVTNDIMVGINDSYDWNKDNYHTGVNKIDYDSEGFTDPSFHATWRALDQKAFPLNLDLFGSFAPNWFDARTATGLSDGRIAEGGDVGSFGSAISFETKSFTAYGSANAAYIGERGISYPGASDHLDSHWQYGLSLATQTRFCDHFSVNLGASETFNTDERGFNYGTQQAYSFSGENVTDFNVAFNYHIIPNRLVAAITYNYNIYENENHSDAGQFTDYTHDNSESVIGARLQYTFN